MIIRLCVQASSLCSSDRADVDIGGSRSGMSSSSDECSESESEAKIGVGAGMLQKGTRDAGT